MVKLPVPKPGKRNTHPVYCRRMLSWPELAPVGQLLLAVLAIAAAGFDLRRRRIPNWLNAAGALSGLLWNGWAHGWPGVLHASFGLAVGLGLYLPLWLLHARGAGDVKLFAAAGAIAGPANAVWLFVFTAILGGIAALALVTIRGRVGQTRRNVGSIVTSLLSLQSPAANPQLDVHTASGLRMPHAPVMAVAVAALVVLVRLG